jgi:hypothetical protein
MWIRIDVGGGAQELRNLLSKVKCAGMISNGQACTLVTTDGEIFLPANVFVPMCPKELLTVTEGRGAVANKVIYADLR